MKYIFTLFCLMAVLNYSQAQVHQAVLKINIGGQTIEKSGSTWQSDHGQQAADFELSKTDLKTSKKVEGINLWNSGRLANNLTLNLDTKAGIYKLFILYSNPNKLDQPLAFKVNGHQVEVQNNTKVDAFEHEFKNVSGHVTLEFSDPSSKTTISAISISRIVEIPTESVTGTVWADINQNDLFDNSEPGVEGISVELRDMAQGKKVGETITDLNGRYFLDIPTELDYRVFFKIPNGKTFVAPSEKSLGIESKAFVEDMLDTMAFSSPFEFTGALVENMNAGVVEGDPMYLGQKVWLDENQNGTMDVEEKGAPDVSVSLYTCDHQWMGKTRSDEFGNYLFRNVAPNKSYYLRFSQPDEMRFSSQLNRNPLKSSIDSDIDPGTGRTDCFTFSGGILLDLSAGLVEDDDKAPTLIRINTGGSKLTSTGQEWAQDLQSFPHASLQNATSTTGWNHSNVENFTDAPSTLFGTQRFQPSWAKEISYAIPVVNGTYDLSLYFAEKQDSKILSGERIFGIEIEDQLVMPALDVAALVGKSSLQKTFQVVVTDGDLNLVLRRKEGDPMISGIQITDLQHLGAPPQLTTNLDEAALLKIYPNPATDQFAIQFEPNELATEAFLKIYDQALKCVSSKQLGLAPGQYEITIPINNLRAGMYMVELKKSGATMYANVVVR